MLELPFVSQVTVILENIDKGDSKAAEELLPLVYQELRRLAAVKMLQQPPGQTLQPTALVHEAYLKLVKGNDGGWNGRKHFFATAAEAMRQILIDRARKKGAAKHGNSQVALELDAIEIPIESTEDRETLLAVNEALSLLEKKDPARADVVKMKFFVGMTEAKIAEVLGVTTRTVERHWAFAKAWLFEQIKSS